MDKEVKIQKSKVKNTSQNSRPKADQPVAEKVSKTVAKPAVKTVKKEAKVKATVKVAPKETKKKVAGAIKVDVYDVKGKVVETIDLPAEVFGRDLNPKLVAQAVRVYLANQRRGTASTKTRGEVTGSTRKIYRQKGTGRARHGGVRAPIFVHGGIAFGPKPHDYSLNMPKKMKKAALFSALSAKVKDGEVKIVSGLEKVEAKTKAMADIIRNLGLESKNKKVLVVMPEKLDNVNRATRNIDGVEMVLANNLNIYEVLNSKVLLLMKNSVAKFGKQN